MRISDWSSDVCSSDRAGHVTRSELLAILIGAIEPPDEQDRRTADRQNLPLWHGNPAFHGHIETGRLRTCHVEDVFLGWEFCNPQKPPLVPEGCLRPRAAKRFTGRNSRLSCSGTGSLASL